MTRRSVRAMGETTGSLPEVLQAARELGLAGRADTALRLLDSTRADGADADIALAAAEVAFEAEYRSGVDHLHAQAQAWLETDLDAV